MVQRSKDCHNDVITSPLQGAIERRLQDNHCDPLFIAFMIPDNLPPSAINIDFTYLGFYLYSESMSGYQVFKCPVHWSANDPK